MSLSIVIPVHNEVRQLKITIKKLLTLKKKINFEIIFIDDFSFDGSYELIKKFQKKSNLIKVFKNPKKGLGSAIQTGIKKSKKIYLCVFMCDLSDDVNDIERYYKTIKQDKKLDAVLGTRFSKDSKVSNYPFFKLFLNRIANNVIKLIFFSDFNDFTNAFKIYKRKTLVQFLPIVSENFNVFLELPLKIITRNYFYKVISINWKGRTIGESKFKIKEMSSMYIFTLLYCLFEKILLNKKHR
tara:strand:+ start:1600 stop:2322 length:723 start_codon:yes stop_codon:yes gene_type:complete